MSSAVAGPARERVTRLPRALPGGRVDTSPQVPRRRVRSPLIWLAVACIWPLVVVTFSVPGRALPGSEERVDAVATVKVVVRVASLLVLAAGLLTHWRHRRRPVATRAFLPLVVFLGLAFASALWSALPTFSLGQAGSLAVLVLLGGALAVAAEDEAATSQILGHLSGSLLVLNGAVLAVHLVDPQLSGLDRHGFQEFLGSRGLVHPTNAGATAAVGMLLLISARLLWGWGWTRALLVPGMAVHASVLFLATARGALFITVILMLATTLALVGPLLRAVLVLLACVGIAGVVAMDPGFDHLKPVAQLTTHYIERGEPAERLSSLNGRTFLWRQIWASFTESPIIGHGYFVTSRTGRIDVPEWFRPPANRTAHNVILQVLVTTGVVGLALFLWGLAWPLGLVLAVRSDDRHRKRVVTLATFALLYYVGAGMIGDSFMGPLQPESVTFFVLLGLLVGTLPGSPSAVRV